MPLVRFLVDGYSLLHNWPELAPGQPRFSATARGELISRLTQYHDACGTALTIVFDGTSGGPGTGSVHSTPAVEVLFTRSGQTADQLIERAAYRLSAFGEVLVVTDDFAERDTVISLGGMASSCLNFINTVEHALADLDRDVKQYNLREKRRFKSAR